MTLEIKDNEGRIEILQDVTLDEILQALSYIKHQRELQRAKYKRLYVPNGNPRGRPRKNPPAEKIDTA